MSKTISFIFAFILLISLTSAALTFDNVKSIDGDTVTIRDNFGLGGKLVEIEQVSNTQFCSIDCDTVWKVTIHSDENNFLDELKFKGTNGKEKTIPYNFEISEGFRTTQVPIYSQECSVVKLGNTTSSCSNNIIGYNIEYIPIWKDADVSGKLSVGEHLIKLSGQKKAFESVDWIPTFYGKEIKEWAWWIGTEPIGYWKFNENNGDANDSTSYGNNLTNQDVVNVIFSPGKLGNASSGFEGAGANYGFNNDNVFNFSNLDFTMAIWVNLSVADGTDSIFSNSDDYISNGCYGLNVFGADAQNISFIIKNIEATEYLATANISINDSLWHRIVVTRDGDATLNSVLLYQDNVLVGNVSVPPTVYLSNSKNLTVGGLAANANWLPVAELDDLQMYNLTWSSTDVTGDWNGGDGKEAETTIELTLNLPIDNAQQTNTTILFNCSIVSSGATNITNASLIVDNIIKETEIYVGGVDVEELYTQYAFGSGYHNWSCFAYDTGDTIYWANNNFTFQISDFIEEAEYYQKTAYETAVEKYQLNLSTIPSILSVSSELYYNGTFYESITSCNSSSWCQIDNTIDIDLVDSATEQKEFFWQVNVFNGTSSTIINTTSLHQNISQIHFVQCNATYPIVSINFTCYDESNESRIDNFNFQGEFEYWLGKGTQRRNLTISNASADEVKVCVLPNRTFFTDASIEYDEAGNTSTYVKRTYFFFNNTFNNTMENLSLYLLESEDSTTFIQEVTDSYEAVENAYIYTYRYYPGSSDPWKLSQITKTNSEGKTVGFYEAETAIYKHLIYVDGTLRFEETEGTKMIPESVPYTISWDISLPSQNPGYQFDNETGLVKLLEFDDAIDMVSFTYTDTNSTFSQGRLSVYLENYSMSDTLICNETSILASAILTCNVTTFEGSFIARGYVTRSDGELLIDTLRFVVNTVIDTFGKLGLLLSFFIILVAAMAFLWHPIMGIISVNVSLIMVNIIGLAHFGGGFIFGVMAVSMIIIWMVKD